LPDEVSLAAPICDMGLALTSPKFSLVQTFLVFLRSAGDGAAACDSCTAACDEADVDAESCKGTAGQESETTAAKADVKNATATIIQRLMEPEYQGSAFAESVLPNSARMACSASFGVPIRRYCEYDVRS
jgi:hypothetical protein